MSRRTCSALAAWAVKTGEGVDILVATFSHAFDPAHPDYWGAAPNKQNQRQVESSVVAWALWLARDLVCDKLSAAARRNVNAWLASCTQYPVRTSNWAWFTAVNQAVRMDLAHRWPEFSGDEKWMLEDLAFVFTGGSGADGWYSDSLNSLMLDDYKNSWVFASHFLYWNKIAGGKYPVWSAKFTLRLKQFLEPTPYFFCANGSHVLYGRSLIYRWAAVTPLVLAYDQGLWPHSAGLLKRIVRGNFEVLKLGAFDEAHGKLRRCCTLEGSRAICESYVDNGHPYWECRHSRCGRSHRGVLSGVRQRSRCRWSERVSSNRFAVRSFCFKETRRRRSTVDDRLERTKRGLLLCRNTRSSRTRRGRPGHVVRQCVAVSGARWDAGRAVGAGLGLAHRERV